MWEAIRFCAVPTSHACMRPLPPTRFLFSLSRPRDRAPPRRHHGLRSVLSIVPMAAPSATLPAPALENIASCLLSGADSQTGLLALVALAGVDRHWRRTVRRLRAEDNLVFDALEVCNRKTLGRPLLQQEITFAKASPDTKASFFLSAARLFVGYGEVAFVGPGVTDLLLLEVARKLQHGLVAVRMQVGPGPRSDSHLSATCSLRSRPGWAFIASRGGHVGWVMDTGLGLACLGGARRRRAFPVLAGEGQRLSTTCSWVYRPRRTQCVPGRGAVGRGLACKPISVAWTSQSQTDMLPERLAVSINCLQLCPRSQQLARSVTLADHSQTLLLTRPTLPQGTSKQGPY